MVRRLSLDLHGVAHGRADRPAGCAATIQGGGPPPAPGLAPARSALIRARAAPHLARAFLSRDPWPDRRLVCPRCALQRLPLRIPVRKERANHARLSLAALARPWCGASGLRPAHHLCIALSRR